jgi:peptidyl-prolyl cis-trans isomerase B (cyclophilin B)
VPFPGAAPAEQQYARGVRSVPTNKQRRQAAQRHLQRQLERRAEQARKRRRNVLTGVVILVVLVVGGAAALIAGLGGGDDNSAAASSTSSASVAPAGQTTVAGPCTYTTDGQGSAGVAVSPPSGDIATTGTLALTMTTSAGAIGLNLDRATAPCAAASFEALTQQKFFDGTTCHRETNSPGLQVLQCGDPSASGSGGPGYSFPTQVTGTETYPRGTIAMANSGSGTDGSQFFLVYGDSLQGNPNYTVVGTIDQAGLAVLDAIAAAGIEGGATDGAPATPVTITSMTVAQ